MYKGYITDIEGIKIGHAQNFDAGTGLTVLIPPQGNTASVDVRGGGPGTRETDLLNPVNTVSEVSALVLSGGSSYGLAGSIGVVEELEKDGIGFKVPSGIVPIVPQAILYDLDYKSYKIRPDKKMGKDAYKNASFDENRQGIIGAGTGATVGKALGKEFSMKSGLGSATICVGDLKVSAIVSVNAMGDIFDDEKNKQIAGILKNNKFIPTLEVLEKISEKNSLNTTIGIVATNGKFSKTELRKIASMTHNGYARAIRPVHTMMDGDTIFSLATNKVSADLNLVGSLGAKVMARAIANAIYFSKIENSSEFI
ncbi:P1 family peptidase [Anaerococcus hydrogenalis]|uniref:Peptidase n=1 Tax=Anaerococcus hydrogenalis TaxID=33029 RepID=A0A2N6UIM5_9FIRM|nr:P1 family peptidase [Anaerococcus hydrogenalis]MDK7694767.1 P1 family peptidase [Anaerococcus hydrogenalis]MDK7696679.1 P1 family peptidase [Anaerococcus hydrogenalis]MDK7707794.1 P1 family peptidase [Anaerococcus hydrogenalis]PMC81404.1 peptidase [Anaerococcus hydrogenalis]